MYSLSDHAAMIADGARTRAYLRALEQSVTPGCVVADIGSGTGILALLAVRLGAGRVYAIESGDVIEVAKAIARKNGLRERIQFIKDVSTAVALESAADIVVSDLHGVLPLFSRHLESIIDARKRLLAAGGIMIPREDKVFVAPVEAERLYAAITGPWENAPFNLNMGAARRQAVNAWRRHGPEDVGLLAPGALWTRLDYRSVESHDAEGECAWRLARRGTTHGFSVWFESTLADEVRLSNAPGNPGLVYGAAFFPLEKPAPVDAGDTVHLRLKAKQVGGDYVWRWDSEIRGTATNTIKARYRQSTFYAAELDLESLNKRAADYSPELEGRGRATLEVLQALDEGRRIDDIASNLSRDLPGEFLDVSAAAQFTARLAARYKT